MFINVEIKLAITHPAFANYAHFSVKVHAVEK